MSKSLLLTNDDGIRARGLRALYEALRADGHDIVVVAPDREKSAAAHSLTIHRPLRVDQVDDGWFAVDGTPTDCVNLAFFQLLDHPPDAVVSGINAGYNLGEDVTYSGTVAGALEGRILGAPSLAISADSKATDAQLAQAGRIAARLTKLSFEHGLPGDALANVNVPPEPTGFRVTRQGRRAFREGIITRQDPKGRDYYWIGLAPNEWQPDSHADHTAVHEGLVSITPLHSDMTFHRGLPEIESWEFDAEGMLE